jgi:hypothetical protein
MKPKHPTGPPMTLGNMTTNSVKMRAKLPHGAAVTKIKT